MVDSKVINVEHQSGIEENVEQSTIGIYENSDVIVVEQIGTDESQSSATIDDQLQRDSDFIDEFDDFEVLDEIVEDEDDVNDSIGKSGPSKTNDQKTTPKINSTESRKRSVDDSKSTASSAKKRKSESTKRSRSPSPRRRRSRSRSRHGYRRRSRSRSNSRYGRRQRTRTRSRSRKRTPDKKTNTTRSNAKKGDEKKSAESAISASKKTENGASKTTPVKAIGLKNDTATEKSSNSKKNIAIKKDQHQDINSSSSNVTGIKSTANNDDPKLQSPNNDAQSTSNTFDGDYLEVTVPEGASLDESYSAISDLQPQQTAAPEVDEKPSVEVSNVDAQQDSTPKIEDAVVVQNRNMDGVVIDHSTAADQKDSTAGNLSSDDCSSRVKPSKPVNVKKDAASTPIRKPSSTTTPASDKATIGKAIKKETDQSKANKAPDHPKNLKKTAIPRQESTRSKANDLKPSSTSAAAVQEETESKRTNQADTKEELGLFSRTPLTMRRQDPVPQVKAYVDSILNLEYDVKVYCSFYCVACPLLLPTTQRYEEHLSSAGHKKNVVRWRICQDLLCEDLQPCAKRQLDVENFAETIIGADQVVEICKSDGVPCNFICVMCSSFHPDVDALLSHLTNFQHIENYMEKTESNLFKPPAISCSQFETATLSARKDDPSHVAKVSSAARSQMMRQGRGYMKSYTGEKYHDIHGSSMAEVDEMEETVMMSLMEQLFAGDGSYKIKWNRIDACKSVGNEIYEKQPQDVQERVIGLQTIVEIWFPNRRMPPVFYCTACNYMVTNVISHCSVTKHWIEYFDKCYKSISECLLLEADDENALKESLLDAVKHVLQLEGNRCRIQNVIQILADPGVIFCAVNAQIAKQIVDEMGLKIVTPKPQQTMIKKAATKTTPAKKPTVDKAQRKDQSIAKVNQKSSAPKTSEKPQGSKSTVAKKESASKNTIAGSSLSKDSKGSKPALAKKVPAKGQPQKRSASTQEKAITRRPKQGPAEKKYTAIRQSYCQPSGIHDRKRIQERRAPSPVRRQPKSKPVGRVRSMNRRKSPVLNTSTHRQFERNRERQVVQSIPVRIRPRTPPTMRRHEHEQYPPAVVAHGHGRVSPADLRRLTEVLRRYVNVDYGRNLTEEDLDQLRMALPHGTVDDLLELLRRAPGMSSFESFFAQHAVIGTGPPTDANIWPMPGIMEPMFMNELINDGDKTERRASFGEHQHFGHGRLNRPDDSSYHPHRQFMDRHEQRLDEQSRMLPSGFRGGVPATPTYDPIQSFENSRGAAADSIMGNESVVYAPPLASSYAEQSYMQQQQPNIFGGIYGRNQDGAVYGGHVQNMDANPPFPSAPSQSTTVADFWFHPSNRH